MMGLILIPLAFAYIVFIAKMAGKCSTRWKSVLVAIGLGALPFLDALIAWPFQTYYCKKDHGIFIYTDKNLKAETIFIDFTVSKNITMMEIGHMLWDAGFSAIEYKNGDKFYRIKPKELNKYLRSGNKDLFIEEEISAPTSIYQYILKDGKDRTRYSYPLSWWLPVEKYTLYELVDLDTNTTIARETIVVGVTSWISKLFARIEIGPGNEGWNSLMCENRSNKINGLYKQRLYDLIDTAQSKR